MKIRDMLYEFETVEGAGGGDGGVGTIEGTELAGAGTDAGAGAAAAGEGIETPGLEAGGEPSALSAEDLTGLINDGIGNAFTDLLARAEHEDRVRAAQTQAAQQREAGQQLPEWDPFNPEVVQAHVMAGIAPAFEALMERFAPALEVAGDYRNSQGEQEANSVLDELSKELENSDFDRERTVREAAFRMNRMGMEPEQALRSAAEDQIKFETAIEQRGIERFKTQAQNLGNQTTQDGSGGAGAAGDVVQHPRGPQAYRDQLNRSLAARGQRAGIGTPTG